MNYINKNELECCLSAMAVLDIIMMPKEDEWLRLVSFYKNGSEHGYILDNGSGDRLTVFFVPKGAMIIGFDHESDLNQLGEGRGDESFINRIYAGAPEELVSRLSGEERLETTFCMWCTDGTNWVQNETAESDGGRAYLLGYIRQNAVEWCRWAEDYYDAWAEKYYDKSVHLSLVQRIYQGAGPSEAEIIGLNPCRNAQEAMKELSELLG